jgi:succinate-semialdehyde dehydrogenase/glutarate-semialdehyde dehydrogenase
MGSRHGEHGILKYTDAQTIAIEKILPVAAPRWLPARHYAKVMTQALRVMRRLPGVK